MDQDKLKPCKYCGGIGIFSVEKDAWNIPHVWLQCNRCHAYVIADDVYQAAEKWNEGKTHHAV